MREPVAARDVRHLVRTDRPHSLVRPVVRVTRQEHVRAPEPPRQRHADVLAARQAWCAQPQRLGYLASDGGVAWVSRASAPRQPIQPHGLHDECGQQSETSQCPQHRQQADDRPWAGLDAGGADDDVAGTQHCRLVLERGRPGVGGALRPGRFPRRQEPREQGKHRSDGDGRGPQRVSLRRRAAAQERDHQRARAAGRSSP